MFQRAEGNVNYLERMKQDGSGRAKAFPYPIIENSGDLPGPKMAHGARCLSRGQQRVALGDGHTAGRWKAATHMQELLRPRMVVERRFPFRAGASRHRKRARGEAWRFRSGPEKRCLSFPRKESSPSPNRARCRDPNRSAVPNLCRARTSLILPM